MALEEITKQLEKNGHTERSRSESYKKVGRSYWIKFMEGNNSFMAKMCSRQSIGF